MTEYTYKIEPRIGKPSGGYRLRLFEDGEEVGGGIFPDCVREEGFPIGIENQIAKERAEQEAWDWLNSRESAKKAESQYSDWLIKKIKQDMKDEVDRDDQF